MLRSMNGKRVTELLESLERMPVVSASVHSKGMVSMLSSAVTMAT